MCLYVCLVVAQFQVLYQFSIFTKLSITVILLEGTLKTIAYCLISQSR
jgi:hypothetical protein